MEQYKLFASTHSNIRSKDIYYHAGIDPLNTSIMSDIKDIHGEDLASAIQGFQASEEYRIFCMSKMGECVYTYYLNETGDVKRVDLLT